MFVVAMLAGVMLSDVTTCTHTHAHAYAFVFISSIIYNIMNKVFLHVYIYICVYNCDNVAKDPKQ